MKYFAYGSNMDKDRMKERKINFTSRQFAKLVGYKLVFNKKAKDGEFAYANIIASESDFVEGALYEFPESQIILLDQKEGYPFHYDKTTVKLTDNSGNQIEAITYVAQAKKIRHGLLPQKKYLNHLLAGQDILSKEYFDQLTQTKTCDD
ncbi:MAG: gamma-glutamylcyclotransferase family protein [Ignavibacteria bacterium]|nr:gamma-glutamylcyclotransferase family protein [Ignavibacteria bacterium]